MTSTSRRANDKMSCDARPTGMVVGIDGSGPSLHALEWAVARTDQFGPVQPVIAWHHPWWSYMGQTVPRARPFEDAARAEIERAISSVRSSMIAEPIVVRARSVSALIDVGASAGLIVVGTRGRSGRADGLVGSVAAGVVARSPVPVAVVPPSAPIDDRHRRVVVGFDGSPNSIRALQWAVDNVPAPSVIEAVEVWAPAPPLPGVASSQDATAQDAHARALLERTLSGVERPEAGAATVQADLVHGDPRSVLRERSASSDLLVLGARGRGGLAHLLLGSVSTALVHHPNVTTVVVPARS